MFIAVSMPDNHLMHHVITMWCYGGK